MASPRSAESGGARYRTRTDQAADLSDQSGRGADRDDHRDQHGSVLRLSLQWAELSAVYGILPPGTGQLWLSGGPGQWDVWLQLQGGWGADLAQPGGSCGGGATPGPR